MRKKKQRETKSIIDRQQENKKNLQNYAFYQDALFMHAIKQMDLWRMTVLQTKNIDNASTFNNKDKIDK